MQSSLLRCHAVPGALRHLDLVLDLPGLDAVQWSHGAGNGPAARWIESYRKIGDAGKGVQVCAETADDALTVLKALGPERLWLHIDDPVPSLREAEEFMAQVRRLS